MSEQAKRPRLCDSCYWNLWRDVPNRTEVLNLCLTPHGATECSHYRADEPKREEAKA